MVTRDGAHSFTAVSPDLTTAKGAPAVDCSKPRPPNNGPGRPGTNPGNPGGRPTKPQTIEARKITTD